MKQFFDMCSLLNNRSFWVVSLLLLMGQSVRANAPDDSPGRRAPKVLGLGNRVFLDYNRDGIQNDADPGVSGLTVRLYRQGILRGTTTTGSSGDYAFVNANVSEGLLPDTDYEIRIAVTDISSRTLVLSRKDQGADDNLDSDAQIAGSVAVIYARTNTSALDTPNDSYDFGLSAEDPDLSIVKSASQSQVVLGSNASFTIRVDNNSTGTATNVIVKDTLGAGMTYVSSSPAATVTTAGSLTILTWNVGTILGGANSILNLTVNTTQEGVLYNTAYVTTTDAEPATKNNVSRACVTVPIKLCPGDEYVASVPAGYTNVQWYRNGAPVSNASSLTITSAGSYSFTADYTTCPANGCCPIIVEDGILPALAITPATPAICAGASTVLSLTGCGTGTILWSTGESTASITVSPTSTATGVYSVTCNSTTYGTCTAFASTTVTVNANPIVALSSATICSGEVASLTATAGFAQYQYSAGLTVGAQPNVATGTTAGTYSVTAISTEGCSGTATGTITVNPLPVAVIAATSTTICNTESVTMTASNSNAAVTSTLSYRWSTNETTASIIVSPNSTTPYSVTITSAEGCVDTESQTITVNPLPVAAIAASSLTICSGASSTLTASNTNAAVTSTLSYLWSTSATTASITVSPVTTTAYSVTVTSAEGCADVESVTIMVNPTPVVTLTSATICSGEVASLTATPGFAQYQYSAGLTVGAQPNVATGTASGTYSVTAISTEGCSGTATGTITVNPLPVAVIAATSTTICNTESVTLTASNSNAAVTSTLSYRWSTNETTASIIVSPNSTTPYSVTITSAEGCVDTESQTITVNPLPVAAIAASSLTICSGASSTLTASNSNAAVTSTLSYRWSTGDVTASITVSPVTTTAYSVTVTSAEGCSDVESVTITVNPTPVVTLTSATICSGNVASLTATAGFAQYQFSAGLTPVDGQPNVATGTASGTYSVTALSSAGCSGTATGTITVNPLPVASIAASSLTVCDGTSVTLTASNTNAAVTSSVSYLWSDGATTAQTVVTTSGVYSVTVTSAEGCSDVESTTITVNPKPVLTVSSPDLSIFAGESTTLTIGGCSGTLAWNTGDAATSLIVAPLATTTYSVTCTLSTGCASSTSVTVTVTNAPSYTMPPMAIAATCSGANPNNDARIVLTTLQDVAKVGISLGNTYSGPAFAGATDVVSGGVTFSGLNNPTAKQIYTLRLFSANGDYFVDVQTTLSPAECVCPAPKCVPILITKVR